MHKHLSRKQLIKLIAKSSGWEQAVAEDKHVSYCKECADAIKHLYSKLFLDEKHELKPSAELKQRIIRSYQAIANEQSQPSVSSSGLRFMKWAGVATAVMLIIISSIVGYNHYTSSGLIKAFDVAKVYGTVYVNNQSPLEKLPVEKVQHITTRNNSNIQLKYRDNIDLAILSNTDFIINDFTVYKTKATVVLSCSLVKGTIKSKINHHEYAINYIYKTSYAVIKPLGTKILLYTDQKKTIVLVKSGKVSVSSIIGGDALVAEEGNAYRIDNTITRLPWNSGLTMEDALSSLLYPENNVLTDSVSKKVVSPNAPDKKDTGTEKNSINEQDPGKKRQLRRNLNNLKRESRTERRRAARLRGRR